MKTRSKFFKVYISVVIAFLVLLVIGAVVLYVWLGKFEASQPENIVQSIITDYVEKGKFSALRADYGLRVSEYESDKDIDLAMTDLVKGKKLTMAYNSFKPEGIDIAYTIKSDDTRVLNVYLTKGADRTYKVSYTEFDKAQYTPITITKISGIKITINGKELSDDKFTDLPLPVLPDNIKKDDLVRNQTVILTDFVSNKQDVKASIGNVSVDVIEAQGSYTVKQNIDSETADKIAKFALDATKAYAAYMQEDAGFGAVAKYLDRSTDFYTNVRTIPTVDVMDHTGYKDENLYSGDVFKYSDSLYSCHVKLTHVLFKGNRVFREDLDKLVFITVKNGELKVIDMQRFAVDNKGQ